MHTLSKCRGGGRQREKRIYTKREWERGRERMQQRRWVDRPLLSPAQWAHYIYKLAIQMSERQSIFLRLSHILSVQAACRVAPWSIPYCGAHRYCSPSRAPGRQCPWSHRESYTVVVCWFHSPPHRSAPDSSHRCDKWNWCTPQWSRTRRKYAILRMDSSASIVLCGTCLSFGSNLWIANRITELVLVSQIRPTLIISYVIFHS